jgi:hypothetical protein
MSDQPIDLTLLARHETARLLAGCLHVATHSEPLAGGALLASERGTWCNFACGIALDGPLTDAQLDRLETFYIERGQEPRIETSPYIHADALAQLAQRAWVVRRFETVLYRPLRERDTFAPIVTSPTSLRVQVVQPGDDALLRTWARVQCEGFTPQGKQVRDEDVALALRTIDHHHSFAFLATIDGTPAAAGACEVRGTSDMPIAALFGHSTAQQFRRCGIQQAMIAARLAFARSRGAVVATIGGSPGAGTERNVRRMGFEVAYTMTVLVKPGDGLASAG